jgi:hypothetical protein
MEQDLYLENLVVLGIESCTSSQKLGSEVCQLMHCIKASYLSDIVFLGCDTMWTGEEFQHFRQTSCPSSALKTLGGK